MVVSRHSKDTCEKLSAMHGEITLHTNLSECNIEKVQVQASLRALYDVYLEKFEVLRSTNANGNEITALLPQIATSVLFLTLLMGAKAALEKVILQLEL